jgi:hypothetical protein
MVKVPVMRALAQEILFHGGIWWIRHLQADKIFQ